MALYSRERISTEAVPPGQRVAFWEASSAQSLVGLRCATFDDAVLSVARTAVRLDELRVTDIAGNAHVIERTAHCVRTVPKASLFVSLVLQSDAFFYHAGGCARVGPGDLIVYDTREPYLFGFPGPMRQILFDVPLAALGDAPARAPRLPVRHAGDSAAGRLHGGALREISRHLLQAPDAAALAACRDRLLAVVAPLVDAARGDRPERLGTSAAAHQLAAEAFIERHLGDPALDAAMIAAACGLSPRHVGRLFAAHGMTLMQFVMERRLQAAHARLLADPRLAVAQVAWRCGFASASHFTRVFRARFSCTPSQARRAAAAGVDLP